MNVPISGSRLALGLLALFAAGAHAQTASSALHLRSLVATCASCHGTDGRAVAGEAMVALRGQSQADIVAKMSGCQDGTRPATVMHQLAKGYTPEQIEHIAAYFAAQK